MRSEGLFLSSLAIILAAGCGVASGKAWVAQMPEDRAPSKPFVDEGWKEGDAASPKPGDVTAEPPVETPEDSLEVRDFPDGVPRAVVAPEPADNVFRNTYYDFPREGQGQKDATIFDASCGEIAKVTRVFHDQVCVQGSGRLDSGATVSFAKRDCTCAAVCPRTGQKICFERLDPAPFPTGRGATGRPITPLRTVAVDTTVIPLGTPIFVQEFRGLPRPDGTPHDGCFLAEDRGLKVRGRQIDVFTGDPALTARWNALMPSNHGVHVSQNDPRCRNGS